MEVRPRPPGRAKRRAGWQWEYGLWIGGTAGSIILGCVAVLFSSDEGPLERSVNDPSLIAHINLNARTWRAGEVAFFKGWRIGDVQKLGGSTVSNRVSNVPECALPDADVPPNFDARARFPRCFPPPYAMGNCSASWAMAAAGSMSKRFCIANSRENAALRLSPQQLLSCEQLSRGCQGGELDTVWGYMKTDGLVTESCFPYQADDGVSCAWCAEEQPKRTASVCRVGPGQIRREIFLNGPVLAPIMLMNDFLVYRSGVYQETRTASQFVDQDRQRMLHAVTVLGWGVQDSVDYWIIENAWGEDWGEGGYAKVASGDAKAKGILLPEFAFAGTPRNSQMEMD